MTSNAIGGLRGWSHSWVGRTSVVGTGLLALGGFTLSFAALRDLAVRVGMPADLGWIWPLLIDGMIVEATLAVVALAQRGSRAVWYAWFLLAVVALVSVGSNGAHAVISGHGWAGAAAASVPPVVLLATTHLTVLLMAAPEASAAPARVPAAVVAPELQPEPGPDDGGGTPALVDGHVNGRRLLSLSGLMRRRPYCRWPRPTLSPRQLPLWRMRRSRRPPQSMRRLTRSLRPRWPVKRIRRRWSLWSQRKVLDSGLPSRRRAG